MESNQLEQLLPPQPGAVPADQDMLGEQNGAALTSGASGDPEHAAAQPGSTCLSGC
jgi:hypothetical protein